MTFDEAWAIVGPNSLLGEPRSRVLYNLLKLAPAGATAEVGVYQGHTAKLMKLALADSCMPTIPTKALSTQMQLSTSTATVSLAVIVTLCSDCCGLRT